MIDRKCWTAAICLGLMTLVGGDRLSATDPVEMQSAELKAKMEAEGWTPIADSVFERQLGPNKVEHLGFGREGLAWTIKGLTRQLESLMLEHESYPSEDLKKIIDDLSVQIAKAKREMRNAPEGMTSMTEAIDLVGPSCSSNCFSATAEAFPLTGTQGVKAVAEAKFNSACGYSGNTYAYAYVRATTQAEGTKVYIHDDPRTGTNVTSSATASMNGGQDCESRAFASVSISAFEFSYRTIEAVNYQCPAPPLNVTISGPSAANFSTATCSTLTWSAPASGGTAPYSYDWYVNGTQVGTGTSYSRSVCHDHADFTIQATAKDSSYPVQSKSDSLLVDVTYKPLLDVTMSGPSSVSFTTATCSTQTWSASASGGTTPYSYKWYYNGTQLVGTGTSYSRSVCPSHADFTIQATGTDSSSTVQTKSISRAVDVVPPLDVTMSGPSSADFTTATCSTKTWSASASGGTIPYSYKWYYNGTQLVGNGTSYSRPVCYNDPDFTIQATATDGSNPVQSKSATRTVDVSYTPPPPPPPAINVTINGSTDEYFAYTGSCRNVTWTSTISGGSSPYSYEWKVGTTVVGSGSSYTKSVCRYHQPGFTLSLTVTGSNSAIATDTHDVTVEVAEPPCGTNGQACP